MKWEEYIKNASGSTCNTDEVMRIRRGYDVIFDEMISNSMKNEEERVALELFLFDLKVKLHITQQQ